MRRRSFIKNSAFATTSVLISFGSPVTLFQDDEHKKLVDWIFHPDINGTEYGVFHFRNAFNLDSVPDSLLIKVSADNRYRLYVNGHPIGMGPARGSLNHWNYEQYDIAPHLMTGKNTLAAMVVNFGADRPMAQITYTTGFFLEAVDNAFQVLNTGSAGWKVFENRAYRPISFGNALGGKYYVCGPGDLINFAQFPDKWYANGFDDTSWIVPKKIDEERWVLQPRAIPFMEETFQQVGNIVRIEGSCISLSPVLPLTIPPNSKVKVLFDHQVLTIGYPQLHFSGGNKGKIDIIYAESLIDQNGQKGNRNETKGKKIVGYYDCILPDGAKKRNFSPLWLRTFRFVQLDIVTTEEELTIDDFSNVFTAYPLSLNAEFQSNDKKLNSLMAIGWRTLRLCASETFFDCPYYEQLQYGGDTRAQALISLYLSKDDQLVRNAIIQLYQSLNTDGIPLSRYPANQDQIIPPFSLYWISMMYDYYLLRQDTAFFGAMIDGISSVIDYFKKFIRANDMLGYMDHDGFKQKENAKNYRCLADRIVAGTMANCYDESKGFIADTPDKEIFSQHANILGILAGSFPTSGQPKIIHKLLKDDSIIKCSMYFQFYMFNAMDKAGLGDELLENLSFWYQSIEQGLTTFPEKERNTRSDCHAWNSSPLYELLAVTAGIKSLEPGFRKIEIKPHFGKLNKIKATIPHPDGLISLDLSKNKSGLITGIIELPVSTEGNLLFAGVKTKLNSGVNKILQ